MPPDFHKICDNEWTFTSWGIIVHVRGQDELDYIKKHYDVYKEEMNRVRLGLEKSITHKIDKCSARIELSNGISIRFTYDRAIWNEHGIDKPSIVSYVAYKGKKGRHLSLSSFIELYAKRDKIDIRMSNNIKEREKLYNLALGRRTTPRR